MQNRVELIASYWTISGAFPLAATEYSPFEFKDRVATASRAGFKGVGILQADLNHILEGRTLREIKQILDDHGMYAEIEFLTDWFADGERKKRSDVRKKALLDAAEALHAKLVKVGDFSRAKCPMPRLIESFASLCADAEERGTSIGFEPMAVAMISTLEESLAMVEGAGARNGGIVLDLWHVVRLGIPYEHVSRIPLHCIARVELNDATVARLPGLSADAVEPRTYCGEGEFDIRGFIASVRKTGFNGPWGVEIFSEELLDKPLEELATRAFRSTMAQFV